jgi:hypothetical protein
MNSRIQKVADEIEKTKAKIIEFQTLLPELERKKTEMENSEIIRIFRSANVAPRDIADFLEKIKAGEKLAPETVYVPKIQPVPRAEEPALITKIIEKTEVSDNEEE